jgi:hypothetical protein
MNKIIASLLILLFLISRINAQIPELIKIGQTLEKKISVGSSAEEVKKIIGKPKTIESGFPKIDSILPLDLPEQVGQLNNSTWFYFMPIKKITFYVRDDEIFFLNGILVDKDLYNEYVHKWSIYLYRGEMISPSMADSYKLLRDTHLTSIDKDYHNSLIINYKSHEATASFIPVLCIIYDKGTQVVSSTKVFFNLDDKLLLQYINKNSKY